MSDPSLSLSRHPKLKGTFDKLFDRVYLWAGFEYNRPSFCLRGFPEVSPTITNCVWIITTTLENKLYSIFEFCLLFGVEDIDKSNRVLPPIIGSRHQVIPALNKRHILTKTLRAAITVRIKANFLTSFGKLVYVRFGT